MHRIELFFVILLTCTTIGAGSISIENFSLDIGTFQARVEQNHYFKISNIGKLPIILENVRSTCGCIVSNFQRVELEPNAEYFLEVTLKPNTISGEFTKTLYVETNQKDQRYIQLNVKGNAIPIVEVQPKNMIYVGKLTVGQEYHYEFTLKPTEDNVKLKLADVETDASKDVKATLIEQGDVYQLSIVIHPSEADKLLTIEQVIEIIQPNDINPLRIILRGKTIQQQEGEL